MSQFPEPDIKNGIREYTFSTPLLFPRFFVQLTLFGIVCVVAFAFAVAPSILRYTNTKAPENAVSFILISTVAIPLIIGCVDALLPKKEKKSKVIEKFIEMHRSYHQRRMFPVYSYYSFYKIRLQDESNYKISSNAYDAIDTNDEITLYLTPFLGFIRKISVKKDEVLSAQRFSQTEQERMENESKLRDNDNQITLLLYFLAGVCIVTLSIWLISLMR